MEDPQGNVEMLVIWRFRRSDYAPMRKEIQNLMRGMLLLLNDEG